MPKVLSRTMLPIVVVALAAVPVHALPSFSRQTRLSCESCHSTYPQLTAFGRDFKLNGYTMTGLETIDAKASPSPKESTTARTTLKLLPIAPVSVMLQSSYNRTAKGLPGTQNDDVEFPQQLSVFLAGAMTPHLGAFMQVTYDDQGASFGWDNADVRYAHQGRVAGKSADWGVTLNNNPTVQDLWNSTPAWGFPYASSGVAPTPSAATLIEGGLAQEVAGLGAYVMYDDRAYAEMSLYRSAPQGGPQPPNADSVGTISGVAPYWRLAFQHQWAKQYLMVGTFGMRAELFPVGVTGLTDRYTDYALDAQYEREPHGDLTVHGSWIHENRNLEATYDAGGSENRSGNLDTFRVDSSYAMPDGLQFSAGYFSSSGDRDDVLYAPEEATGSRTGSPDSSGFVAQVGYSPWINTRFAAQYVFYDKFNGASSNYDGFGRRASDNDTLYAFAWFVF